MKTTSGNFVLCEAFADRCGQSRNIKQVYYYKYDNHTNVNALKSN